LTLRQSPAITRTPSTSTPQQFPPTSVFDPIDLTSLGIPPTDEAHRVIDKFNTLATNVFNPVTPTQPIEPENPTLPEQVMVEPQTDATVMHNQNGKGEKCQPPKDFDGKESSYKTWFRILEAYIRAYDNLFPNDQ